MEKTVAEKIAVELEKISRALENIPTHGFMRQLLIIYLKEKTGLGKQKIEAVLDGIAEFTKELQREFETEEVEKR